MSTAAIAAKLVEAMKAVDAVEKRGRNTQQNYAYVKATDVANEVRKALNDAGVAFTYNVLSERYWESQTKSGTTQFFCSLMVAVTFTDSKSGESITAQCIGWGADSQEKAPYKAMTGALKYALRMNFLIPDEADPEEAQVHESVSSAKSNVQSIGAPLNGPRPKVIAKAKAEGLRAEILKRQIPFDEVIGILEKFGFKSCYEITEEKFINVTLALEGISAVN